MKCSSANQSVPWSKSQHYFPNSITLDEGLNFPRILPSNTNNTKPMPIDVREYVSLQTRLLTLERDYDDAQLLQSTKVQGKLDRLQASGRAISHLVLQSVTSDLGGRQVLRFTFNAVHRRSSPVNISTGDIVVVYLNIFQPDHEHVPQAIVETLTDSTIQVVCDSPFPDDMIEDVSNADFTIIKVSSHVTYNRFVSALGDLDKAVCDTSHPSNALLNTVLCGSSPEFRNCALESPFEHLNSQQNAAVDTALRATNLAVIHGPPGTGKTHTLIAYISEEVRRGSRLLVVAPSNVAVDNIVERLADASFAHLNIVRVGHPARVTNSVYSHTLEAHVAASDEAKLAEDVRRELDALHTRKKRSGGERVDYRAVRNERKVLRRELREREDAAVARVISSANVVLTTISGVGARVLGASTNAGTFDVVVVDEAAQALEATIWLPFLRARKAILAGDPWQLAGTVKCDEAERDGLKRSILDRVFQCDSLRPCVTMLTVQYRMNNIICGWSSSEFYGGLLEADKSVADRVLMDTDKWKGEKDNEDQIGASYGVVLIDTSGGDCEEEGGREESDDSKDGGENGWGFGSYRNEGEAAIVQRVIRDLMENGVEGKDIGVISPYAGQVGLLRKYIWDEYGNDVEVATVDSFQGREKEVICISLVRSSEGGEIGFLADARRLNVAMTRAKSLLVIVCDSETVCSNDVMERVVDYAEIRGLYRSAVVEFTDIVGTFSLSRRPKEAIAAEKCRTKCKGGNERGEGKWEEKREKVERSDGSKNSGNGHRKTQESDKRGFVDEEDEENMRVWVMEEMEKFSKNDMLVEKRFSSKMSAFERRLIHEAAEDLGIQHASCGTGNRRQVRVWKEGALTSKESGVSRLGYEALQEDENVEEKSVEESVAENGMVSGDKRGSSNIDAREGDESKDVKGSRYQAGNALLAELRQAREGRAQRKEGESTGRRGKRGGGGKAGSRERGQTSNRSGSRNDVIGEHRVHGGEDRHGLVIGGVLVQEVGRHDEEGRRNLRAREEALKRLQAKIRERAVRRKRRGGGGSS